MSTLYDNAYRRTLHYWLDHVGLFVKFQFWSAIGGQRPGG